MFSARLIVVLSTILALTSAHGSFAPQGRMTGGSSVETLRRFPHHVLIKRLSNNYYDGARAFCAGSIVNHRWILTTKSCVEGSDMLELCFQRLYLNKTIGSYSAVVNSNAVHVYPTQYDDMALINLPFSLGFSDTVQPVYLYSGSNIAAGQFVVLPGYDNSSSYNGENSTIPPPSWDSDNKMVYGMFSIASAAACKADLGKDFDFDEYLQYCTKPWSNTWNSPSALDIGSGLLVDWPAKPQLVGLYTGSYDWNNVAVYTNVAKYYSWIQGVINGNPA